MLYVSSNNGESCKDQLCQHPTCWQSNVRRVRDAVKRRNGIKEIKPRRRRRQKPNISFDESSGYSLPTLKVINVMQDIAPYDSDDEGKTTGQMVPVIQHNHGATVTPISPSSLKSRRHGTSREHTYPPHTTPVTPTMSDMKKPPCPKDNPALDEQCSTKKAQKIQFHEIYEYKEVCEDWQETFIATAYLVWCPTNKGNYKRSLRASSAITDYRTRGYKNIVDDVLPLPIEKTTKKYRNLKYPTGGQPYSPCKSPLSKQDYYKQLDNNSSPNGDFIMTTTNVDVPESLITRKKILGNKRRNKDENSNKVLDTSSQLSLNKTTINEETTARNNDTKEKEQEKKIESEKLTKHNNSKRPKTAQPTEKRPTEFGSRRVLPIPSVGIPWGLIPEDSHGHCRNSIPHDIDLGVIMEPVVYVPRSAGRACASPDIIPHDVIDMSFEKLDERYHLTSAYRISPKHVFAPAPTPITPRTRDSMRRRISDAAPSHTNRPLSKTIVTESSIPTIHYEDDGKKIPGRQRSRIDNDQVIEEVQETNRLGETGAEGITAEHENEGLARDKNVVNDRISKFYELESSFRAISPSSRTNIPQDIWAELCGELVDDVTSRDDNTMLRPGYSESSWKPSCAKLPQSFGQQQRTYVGPYSQTILPQMPASLTIVPVPSIQRVRSRTSKHCECKPPRVRPPGIIMPSVPVGSPVPSEGNVPVGSPTPDNSLESGTMQVGDTSFIESGSDGRVVSEGTGSKQENDEETGVEEYLVARDVMSHEVCEMTSDANVSVSYYEDVSNSISSTKTLEVSDLKEFSEQFESTNEDIDIVVSDNNSSVLLEDTKSSISLLDNSVEESVLNNDKSHEDTLIETLVEISNSTTIEPQLSGTTINENHHETTINKNHPETTTNEDQTTNSMVPSDIMVEDMLPRENEVFEQESKESLNSLNEIQPETSEESLLSKVSSDFQLEPFSVQSELLQPIAIESDLLLLTESFLDLSFDGDIIN